MQILERRTLPLRRLGAALLFSTSLGCSSDPLEASDDRDGTSGGGSNHASGGTDGGGASDGGGPSDGGGDPAVDGTPFEFDVPAGERVFVALSNPRVVETDGSTLDWDLAFEGYGVYTNGGLSGPGAGGAFGPLSAPTFLSDSAPPVPLVADEASGAFRGWYDYGSDHVLRSRFHVYGVRDGDRYYKVQLLSYYGDRDGESLSALYTLRYAEVTADGVSETRVAEELDATGDASAPECLNLETGDRPRLTAESSGKNADWHVCFRRTAVSVNGGAAGPRGVEAVDLDAAFTDSESSAEISELTARSELPRFEAVDREELMDSALVYRSDAVASAFEGRWLAPSEDPPAPTEDTWFVAGAEGQRYLLTFDGFEGATADSPGRVAVRVKAVR